jgi:hypothetical protein
LRLTRKRAKLRQMNELSNNNFGLLIAYLIPGFVALCGIAFVSPAIHALLIVPTPGPTVGGFLYLTLACAALGVTISTLRWAIVDPIHSITGIRRPQWNFNKLQDNLGAFNSLIEVHYRYYQFHANMLIAVAVLYVLYRIDQGVAVLPFGGFEFAAALFEMVLFAGSRDTLKKYYSRSQQLLGLRKD